MEIWTQSRIHVTAAFLSRPQAADLPEHIPRARFPETEAIMEVKTLPPHSSDYIQERPDVADKPVRCLRKVCTVYVRAVAL